MLGQSCSFTPEQHEILDVELIRWLRKNVPAAIKKKLFLYHHRVEDTFVIAQWVGNKQFVDVLNLDNTLRNFTREKAQYVLYQYANPLTRKSLAEILRSEERSRRRIETDSNRDKADKLFYNMKKN